MSATATSPSSASPPAAAEAARLTVLDVEYLHLHQADGGDLYLTRYGLPFHESLEPRNWFAPAWFTAKRQRLLGTSTICKIPTKPVRGRSLDLVVRCSRVGERVPLDTDTLCRNFGSEFNSPFEEISRVMELRAGRFGPPSLRIHTKKPLAIYAPPERLALWQTGRSADKFAARQARHPKFRLELELQYLVVYGWIDGWDAEQIADLQGLSGEERVAFLGALTERAERELASKGFRVVDMKAAHIILRRRPNGWLLRRRDGRLAYALVDYELLERTPEHEAWLAQAPSTSPPSLAAGSFSPKN